LSPAPFWTGVVWASKSVQCTAGFQPADGRFSTVVDPEHPERRDAPLDSEIAMLRSILSILAGYVVLTVATMAAVALLTVAFGLPFEAGGVKNPPTAYVIANLLSGAPCAMAAGYVATWLARRKPLAHAGALAGIVFVIGVAFALTSDSPAHSGWYLALLPVIGAAGVALGAWLYARRAQEVFGGVAQRAAGS
jgi:peptidoglycan/LPS O-acetylase OafA/YrhL